jgi:hypothetical protein
LLLCIHRSNNSEKQRQNSRTGDSNYFHTITSTWLLRTRVLTQASCCYGYRTADCFARHDQFHSPVLLPAAGVIIGGYRHSIAETFCAD